MENGEPGTGVRAPVSGSLRCTQTRFCALLVVRTKRPSGSPTTPAAQQQELTPPGMGTKAPAAGPRTERSMIPVEANCSSLRLALGGPTRAPATYVPSNDSWLPADFEFAAVLSFLIFWLSSKKYFTNKNPNCWSANKLLGHPSKARLSSTGQET